MYPGVGTFVLIRPTQTFYERIMFTLTPLGPITMLGQQGRPGLGRLQGLTLRVVTPSRLLPKYRARSDSLALRRTKKAS